MTKDVIVAIKERRSIRQFATNPVEEHTVGRILAAAASAPSAGNLQPWMFYVVYKDEIKADLARAAYNQSFLTTAPVVIVVVAVPAVSEAIYGARGRNLYCLQDTAAATQNLLLAAEGFGLGTCWVGAFDEQLAAAALDCSAQERPVAIVPLGYATKEQPSARARYDLEKITKILR